MTIGPNVRKLIFHKVSVDAVPKDGGIANAIDFLTTPGKLTTALKPAHNWVLTAIQTVREAAEPNRWKQADDETIAAEILKQIEIRRKAI